MTPYRERRAKGHYDPAGEQPESIHSHHLAGLQTATTAPESTEDFLSFTKTELLTLAKERGLSPANAAMSKAELRETLEANE